MYLWYGFVWYGFYVADRFSELIKSCRGSFQRLESVASRKEIVIEVLSRIFGSSEMVFGII